MLDLDLCTGCLVRLMGSPLTNHSIKYESKSDIDIVVYCSALKAFIVDNSVKTFEGRCKGINSEVFVVQGEDSYRQCSMRKVDF